MINFNLFNLDTIDPSWQTCLQEGLKAMNPTYLDHITQHTHWLPGPQNIFNAFSLPVEKVNYILLGESPYPRENSANGYAFWDAQVKELWSPLGLSKKVNRATSLRNIIKMLLVAEGALEPNCTGQSNIASLNKNQYVQTNEELFLNLLNQGFLLLNATLILQPGQVRKDALAWHPFLLHILHFLAAKNSNVQLILFGNIAHIIDKQINHLKIKRLYAEHPYNISFITNQNVIQFFKPMHLLHRR